MAKPTNKTEFIEFCLRALGKPVIEINVTKEQIDDRIDQAIYFWQEYNTESSERYFMPIQVTAEDKERGYFILDPDLIGVYSVLPFDTSRSMSPLFNVQYQIRVQEYFALQDRTLIPYYIAMRHFEFLDQWLSPQPSWDYNRHTNRLYVHINWQRVETGMFMLLEVRKPVNEAEMWQNRWLQTYATELIKQQWGSNLKKFSGVQMPGGISFNGQIIYDEATNRIFELEREMKEKLIDINQIVIG